MSELLKRLAYLVSGWTCVGLVYCGSLLLQGKPTLINYSQIDLLIPFNYHVVWIYLSFFVIIPFGFFYAPYTKVRWMCFSFIAIAFITGLCFIIYPTVIMVPPVDTSFSLSSKVYQQLIEFDVNQNCFPSLHVSLTTIVVWGVLNIKHPIITIVMIIWGTMICLSIIQLRRHVFMDLVGGITLAIILGWLIQCWLKKH